MKRADTTKLLTKILLSDKLSDRKYYAKEVSVDYGTDKTKRVDVMEFVPQNVSHVSGIEKGYFVCYEIKSCEADIFSGHGMNFLGEQNYIVTTMETYRKVFNDVMIAKGEIAKFIKEHNPESATNFGVLVPIPAGIVDLRDRAAIHKEFENPTEFGGCVDDWRLCTMLSSHPVGRNRSVVELLFCMLRSKHSVTNRRHQYGRYE